MYCSYRIFIIASWNLLLSPASSDDLFSPNNSDDIIWNPEESTASQAIVDDFNSGIELMSSGDSDDQFSFTDDDTILLANTVSQSHCVAAEASDTTLKARDGKSSCQTEEKDLPSILSPETLQLFQDPITVLGSPSNKKQRLPGSAEPPTSSEPPLYPGFLPNDQKTDLEWDFNAMTLSQSDKNFFCLSQRRIVPVCCDGPFRSPNMIERCDEGKIF